LDIFTTKNNKPKTIYQIVLATITNKKSADCTSSMFLRLMHRATRTHQSKFTHPRSLSYFSKKDSTTPKGGWRSTPQSKLHWDDLARPQQLNWITLGWDYDRWNYTRFGPRIPISKGSFVQQYRQIFDKESTILIRTYTILGAEYVLEPRLPITENLAWIRLTKSQQLAAMELGYDEESWNNEEEEEERESYFDRKWTPGGVLFTALLGVLLGSELIWRCTEREEDENPNPDGLTMAFAAQEGKTKVVKYLIESNANVNEARKSDGVTALHVASRKGHSDVVKLLLGAEGINVLQARDDGMTALLDASLEGHSDVVKLLLGAEGINVNQAADNGMTALIMASQEGHSDVVKLLLGVEVMNVNQARNDGATALHIASIQGHLDVVKLLLGAEGINVLQEQAGYTALAFAKEHGYTEIVQLLAPAEIAQASKDQTFNIFIAVLAIVIAGIVNGSSGR